jgi:hypothetical protein
MRKSNTNVGLCNQARRHHLQNCTTEDFNRNQVASGSTDDRSTPTSELMLSLPSNPGPSLSTIEGVRR